MNKKILGYKMYISILGVILILILVQTAICEGFSSKYIFAVLSFFGILFLFTYIRNKKIINIIFLVVLVIRILIILKIETPPISDFEILFNSAEKLLCGNNIMNSLDYFYYYPYQTAVVLYFVFILKIYNSVVAIKVANCIFSMGTIIIVYFITKELTNEKSAKMAALCYACFPFSLFYNTILSNQIPGAFFFYLGIYLFVLNRKKENVKYSIGAGVSFGIGNILRPEGVIFIVAILGYELFVLCKNNKKRILKEIAIICGIYVCMGQVASFSVHTIGINEYGLKNNSTNMKFVFGLNLDSKGMWNQEDTSYLGNSEKQKEIITERIKKFNIKNSIPFCMYKIKEILGPGTLWWTFDYLKNDESILGMDKSWWFNEFGEYNRTYFYVVFAFMVLGVISLRDKTAGCNMLLLNVIALNIVIYVLIEIQSRYAYIPQIGIFIISAIGYEWLCAEISRCVNKVSRRSLQ